MLKQHRTPRLAEAPDVLRGLGVRELARLIKRNPATVSRWYRGQCLPDAASLAALQRLGVVLLIRGEPR
jgi:hypothetical protein